MDLPLALEELVRQGRLTPEDGWGPLAQTGRPYAEFAARWVGPSPVPSEQELAAAYAQALGHSLATEAALAREQAKGALLASGRELSVLSRAAGAVQVDEVNVLRRQVVAVATAAWSPASVASNAGLTSPPLPVPGAAFGDFVLVAAPNDLLGLTATAYVSAPGAVRVRLLNVTGGPVVPPAGAWCVEVRRPEVMPPRTLAQYKAAVGARVDDLSAD